MGLRDSEEGMRIFKGVKRKRGGKTREKRKRKRRQTKEGGRRRKVGISTGVT